MLIAIFSLKFSENARAKSASPRADHIFHSAYSKKYKMKAEQPVPCNRFKLCESAYNSGSSGWSVRWWTFYEHRTSNIQRPTSNEKKHSIPNYCCFISAGFLSGHMPVSSFFSIQSSMLDVGCSTFIGFTHYQQSTVYPQPASLSPWNPKKELF